MAERNDRLDPYDPSYVGLMNSDAYNKLQEFKPWRGIPYVPITDARVLGPAIGFLMAVAVNVLQKRPKFSGLHRHIFLTSGGFGLGYYLEQRSRATRIDKHMVLWDYVKRHPEDFPEVFSTEPKRKWKDVLDPWKPVR